MSGNQPHLPQKGAAKRQSTGPGQPRKRQLPPHPTYILKVSSMLADAVEMAPKLAIPLEVRTGARLIREFDLPKYPIALIDLYNPEDGNTYQVMVFLPR